MKKFPGWGLALALILMVGGDVRAEFIDWSFDWNVSPLPIFHAKFGGASFGILGATGNKSFGPTWAYLVGPSLRADTTAPAATSDRYDVSYDLTFHVTDNRSHQSGSVTFHGKLFGAWGVRPTGFVEGSLTNAFSPASEPFSLGGRQYDVSIMPAIYQFPTGDFLPPPEGENISGVFVEIPQEVPEPSGLVLGCSAASAVALAGARRQFRSVCVPCL